MRGIGLICFRIEIIEEPLGMYLEPVGSIGHRDSELIKSVHYTCYCDTLAVDAYFVTFL